jgi:hypothetical protein
LTKVGDANQNDEVISNDAILTQTNIIQEQNFEAGDFVRVITDPVRIKRLQEMIRNIRK